MKTKKPVIRPGQGKPYVKATRKEIEQRLKAAAMLEDWGFEKSSLYWFFRHVFGVEWRQTDRYIAKARARARGR